MVYLSICFCYFDFFHQCLIVFRVQVFTSLGKFIPGHFIIFDVMVHMIASLISLSELLLVYINAAGFCLLILYPASLPNTFDNLIAFL